MELNSLKNLVEQTSAGDREAWTELVNEFTPNVWAIVRRYISDKMAQEDLYQEIFLLIYLHLSNLRKPEHLPAYISVTARNRCLSYLNEYERRTRLMEDRIKSHEDSFLSVSADPESIYEGIERAQMVHSSLNILDSRCATLLRSLFLESDSPSYVRLSSELDMPVSSIGPNRQRCLKKLRKLLMESGFSR